MYYRTPGNLNPILPRSDLTPANIADNFDERTVINDDLNMNGYFIYNLKDPEDDQDATTKIYVDTKQYNINSANITGNLPWSRISNLPTFFPSRISEITIDSDINLGSYKITKNGQEIIGLSNNSVTTPFIANNAVTNDKFLSLDYSKLTNIPENPDNKISTLQVDADLNMNNRKVTSNSQVTLYNQLVPKSYISDEQLYPPIVTSLVACYSLYTLDTEINTGMASVNYWYQSAGNSNAGYYFTPSGNNANRPKLIDHDGGSVPGFALNFTGGQGLFTKGLNAQGWNGIGNIPMFTCFVVMKYNKPNSAATGREACISFDPLSFGKAFYAIDNRDNSTKATTTYGPALFVGTHNGYVRRFRNNNGTGTPIQLAGNTWYLISFSHGPGPSRDDFVANAYVDGKRTVADWLCIAQDGAAFGSMGCGNSSTQTPDREFFDGQISEVIFYSRVLTNSERILVENYMKHKWQLPFTYTG